MKTEAKTTDIEDPEVCIGVRVVRQRCIRISKQNESMKQ